MNLSLMPRSIQIKKAIHVQVAISVQNGHSKNRWAPREEYRHFIVFLLSVKPRVFIFKKCRKTKKTLRLWLRDPMSLKLKRKALLSPQVKCILFISFRKKTQLHVYIYIYIFTTIDKQVILLILEPFFGTDVSTRRSLMQRKLNLKFD